MPKRKSSDKEDVDNEESPPAKRRKINPFSLAKGIAKQPVPATPKKVAQPKAVPPSSTKKKRNRPKETEKAAKIATFNNGDKQWLLGDYAGKDVVELLPKNKERKEVRFRCNLCVQFESIATKGMAGTRKCAAATKSGAVYKFSHLVEHFEGSDTNKAHSLVIPQNI